MSEHPIQGLMKTAMESLKAMVDVNTVVGDPVESQDGSVIIPISRVAFGFAAGGGEYSATAHSTHSPQGYPFGGGSGAGVSVKPVGFLVVGQDRIKMLPVDGAQPMDRLIDLAPELIDKLKGAMKSSGAGAGASQTTETTTVTTASPTMGSTPPPPPATGMGGGEDPTTTIR